MVNISPENTGLVARSSQCQAQILSAFHLNGKIGFPGGKPNGKGLSTGNFSKKRNTFRGIPLFSFLPELSENHCTIYFIKLVPCSLVKMRDFPREKWRPLVLCFIVQHAVLSVLTWMPSSAIAVRPQVSVNCNYTYIQGALFFNIIVFPCMRLISVWLANYMHVLDASIDSSLIILLCRIS